MYRGLIDYMTYAYAFVCKARGRISGKEIQAVAQGAHTVAGNAEVVLAASDRADTAEDRADLAEAKKIDEHIEEMTAFLMSLEIV